MKVLAAPDSFKGSLSAPEAARAIRAGLNSSSGEFECHLLPLADGGEGTVDCLVQATGGKKVAAEVRDPLGRPIEAEYGIIGSFENGDESRGKTSETAVIEMAAASGLPLLSPEERDPMKTTTAGTGELIADALSRGVDKILLGIGGSATSDAGMGMARALGVKFYDESGNELEGVGANLSHVKDIDMTGLDKRVNDVEIEVACDVDNPFYGEKGAARVYATQKGASSSQVEELDRGLRSLAKVMREKLDMDISSEPGSGAAGGLGGGLMVFLGARLKSGIDMILDFFSFQEKMREYDLIISGEGGFNEQSLYGKVIGGIADRTAPLEKPLVVLAGGVSRENRKEYYSRGITAIFSIVDGPLGLEEAERRAEKLLKHTAEEVGNVLSISRPEDL